MRMNQAKRLVTQILLVVSLLFGVIVLTGTTVQAQGWRRYDRHSARVFIYPRVYNRRLFWYDRAYPYYYQNYFPSTHVTEGQGYHDGLNDGKDDAEDGKSYYPQRHNDYKNAETSGYINGYLQGYEEGYSRVAD
jgi:hypothetical protein